jgi:aspartate carbamoyltransferase regulatory subunit
MTPPIPEDLQSVYGEAMANPGTIEYIFENREEIIQRFSARSDDEAHLICVYGEKVGELGQERNQLRAARLEDGLTIVCQRALLDKYDDDNTVLMAREGELNSQVVRLIADKQDLIERNDILREQAQPRNVIVRCSYCGEQICKESEWVPKVEEHMATCIKNPVQKLVAENDKLKARTLSCVFCGEPMESVEALKSHSADCPKHPAVIENAKLKAQLTMRTAQLDSTLETADREWNDDDDVYKERDRLKAQVESLQRPFTVS